MELLSKSVLLLSIITYGACTTATELVLVQVLYRHGERSPTRFYQTDPHKKDWAFGPGQLTNVGKMEEYKLGQYLKKRYVDKLQFMRANFSNKHIYIRSSDVDRTLESAQLVAAGMYPPIPSANWNANLLWQPIPIHTVPEKEDKLLTFLSPSCPRYLEERRESYKNEPLKSFILKYKSLFDYLSTKSGMNVTIDNAWIIEDDTFNEKLHNMSVPAWVQKVWQKLKKEHYGDFGLFVPTKQMKRLKGGPLVKQMLENCDEKVKNSNAIKMYQYSAHDTTLAIWLSALGLYNGIQPGYSSMIMVEMHKLPNSKTNSEEGYVIKILYKNDTKRNPYPLVLEKCTEMCPLKKFKTLVAGIIPEDLEEECEPSSSEVVRPAAAVLLMIIIVGMFA